MKTIYLMRHSESLKPIMISNNDSLQLQNEKWVLTEKGEQIAKDRSLIEELKDFDIVISSNYVRAMSTAKYFTDKNLYIDENFGERKFGINSWSELPKEFGEKQFKNFDYKLENGESLNEVKERQIKSLNKIFQNDAYKKILIVGHSTAFNSLLSKWCELDLNNGLTFQNINFFDGKWNYCQTFKLEFDDNNELLSIVEVV